MAVLWNSGDKAADVALSDGDLTAGRTAGTGNNASVRATSSKSSAKFYWEVTVTQSGTDDIIGIGTGSANINGYPGSDSYGYGYYGANGKKIHNASQEAYGDTYTTADVISVALDLDNGKVWFAKNGTWQNSGNPATGANPAYTGLSGTFFPMVNPYNTDSELTANFGASAFSHAVPTGFEAFASIVGQIVDEVGIADVLAGAGSTYEVEVPADEVGIDDAEAGGFDVEADITDEVGIADVVDPDATFLADITDEVGIADVMYGHINPIAGYLEEDLPALTCEGAGNYYADITLPAITCEGLGGGGGLAAMTVPALTCEAHGGGIASCELPAITCEAEGSHENIAEGAAEIPALTCAAHGGGIASCELPALTCEAQGTVGNVGIASITLPALTVSAQGKHANYGSAALTLPMLRCAATGFRGNVGILEVILPALTIAAEGGMHPSGEADIELPMLTIYATGSNNICRYYDYILEHER